MNKLLLSLVIIISISIKCAIAQPNVITIPGSNNLAYGISPSGSYVAGASGAGGAFLYRINGAAFLNIGGEEAWAVTDLGKAAGTYIDSNFQYNGVPFPIAGFYESGSWSTPGLIPNFAPFSNTEYSYGFGISDDGSTMCGMVWRNAGNTNSFTWNAANGFTVLRDRNASSKALVLSGNGLIAGGWMQGNARLPIFWNPDSVVLDQNVGEVHGMNSTGSLIVGAANGSAFLRDSIIGMQYLTSYPGAQGANANGVSDSGVIVGYYTTGTFPPLTKSAFIYFPGQGMLNLRDYLISQNATNVPAVLESAQGISRDGRTIIAISTFPSISYVIQLDSIPTGISSISSKKDWLVISPNPVYDNTIRIQGNFSSNDAVIKLTDIEGREVISRNISGSTLGNFNLTIDLNDNGVKNISPGIYLLSITSSGNKITKKVILN